VYTVFVFLSILREIKYYRRSLRGLDVESMSMRKKKGGLLVTGYRIQSTSHRVTERIGYMYTETYARIEYIQFCVFSASASIARVSLSLSLLYARKSQVYSLSANFIHSSCEDTYNFEERYRVIKNKIVFVL